MQSPLKVSFIDPNFWFLPPVMEAEYIPNLGPVNLRRPGGMLVLVNQKAPYTGGESWYHPEPSEESGVPSDRPVGAKNPWRGALHS